MTTGEMRDEVVQVYGDCMLTDDATQLTQLAVLLQHWSAACTFGAVAIQERLSGHVNLALQHEQHAERLLKLQNS